MTYLLLFWIFFKVSLFTIGGGQAMIPLLIDELVGANLITEEALFDFLSISELLPGPFATDIATFVGAQTGGFLGSLVTVAGMILPSILLTIILTFLIKKVLPQKFVKDLFQFLRPIVLVLIAFAALLILKELLGEQGINQDYLFKIVPLVLIIFFGSKIVYKKGISPLWFTLLSGLISLVILL